MDTPMKMRLIVTFLVIICRGMSTEQ